MLTIIEIEAFRLRDLMTGKKSIQGELYRGLELLLQHTFPKTCKNCGKVFNTPDHFISETNSLRNTSGLKESIDDNDKAIVELFRNCICGSTFLETYKDRRDMSELGVKRREQFSEIMQLLIEAGFDKETAAIELKKAMRGEDCAILKEYLNNINKLSQ